VFSELTPENAIKGSWNGCTNQLEFFTGSNLLSTEKYQYKKSEAPPIPESVLNGRPNKAILCQIMCPDPCGFVDGFYRASAYWTEAHWSEGSWNHNEGNPSNSNPTDENYVPSGENKPKEKPCPPEFDVKKPTKDWYNPADSKLSLSNEFMKYAKQVEGYQEFLYNDDAGFTKIPSSISGDRPKALNNQVEDPYSHPNSDVAKAQKGHCTIGIGHLVHLGICLSPTQYAEYSKPEFVATASGSIAAQEKPFRERRAQQNAGLISKPEIESYFEKQKISDMKIAIESVVNNLSSIKLSRSQFEAMVDLAFNAVETGMKKDDAFGSLKKENYAEAAELMKKSRLGKNPKQGWRNRSLRSSAMMREDCIGYDTIPK
jgi:GH24 family phage-related lysozyme (muramidase)